MTNLAIECSGTAGSVALFDGENPICYSDLDTSFSSVRTLAVGINQILQGQKRPSFISVTIGPGSFTGLRVGLTTAKMLAMAWKVPVVPVDTLQAIALRAHGEVPHLQSQNPILAVLNAFRGQVFAIAIQFHDQARLPAKLTVLRQSCVLDAQAWQSDPLKALQIDKLESMPDEPRVLVTGPGLKNYPVVNELLNEARYQIVSAEFWNPTATEVARLGQLGLESGSAKDAFSLEPNYIRASAAEEKAKSVGS